MLQYNCKTIQQTFVSQAHFMEGGLQILEISCVDDTFTSKEALISFFFSQLTHLIVQSSELPGVNLRSLSSFTLAC